MKDLGSTLAEHPLQGVGAGMSRVPALDDPGSGPQRSHDIRPRGVVHAVMPRDGDLDRARDLGGGGLGVAQRRGAVEGGESVRIIVCLRA